MHRLAVLLVAVGAALAAAAPLALAQEMPSQERFAQAQLAAPGASQNQPGEPDGEPQPGAPEEPEEPGVEEPGVEPPGVGVEGQLPRTGLEALRIAAFGILFLLSGARLRVIARVREVRDRVRRRLSPERRLRESLERLREEAAELAPPEVEPSVERVEPATHTARRGADRAAR
jgi:hypothetical protein